MFFLGCDVRDRFKNHHYWQEFLAKEKQMREKFSVVPSDPTKSIETRQRVSYRIYRSSFVSTIAAYSSGQDRDSLGQAILHTLKHFDSFLDTCDLALDRARKEYSGGYDATYSMLGLAVLMDLTRDDSKPLARGLKLFDVYDAVWQQFLDWLGFPDNESITTLVWPEAYENLNSALRSSAPGNSKALKTFVEAWYPAMRGTPWYESHRSSRPIYYGYWCFEAAAAARMRSIDVSELRDHPNFPADLV